MKINEKGQIVIPKNLRDQYGLQPDTYAMIREETVDNKKILVIQPKHSKEEFARFLATTPKKNLGTIDSKALYEEQLQSRWTT